MSLAIDEHLVDHKLVSWRSGCFSDWTVVIGTKKFPVHRYILAVGERSSTYFYNQFSGDFVDGTNSVSVLEIGRGLLCICGAQKCVCNPQIMAKIAETDRALSDSFMAILEFIYEGSLQPHQISEYSIVSLLVLADFLQIESFRALLGQHLESILTPDTAHDLLKHCLALNFSLDDVVPACLSMIAKSFSTYSYDQLRGLSPDVLICVLMRSDLVIDDDDAVVCFLARYLRDLESQMTESQLIAVLSFLNDNRFSILGGDALYFLELIAGRDEQLSGMRSRCLECIASQIEDLPFDAFWELSPETVAGILDCDELQIESEDKVFNLIEQYLKGPRGSTLTNAERRKIWKTCRFAYLSAPQLWKANANGSAPSDLVSSGAILAKALQEQSDDQTTLDISVSTALARRLQQRLIPAFHDVPDVISVSNRQRTIRLVGHIGHVTCFGQAPVKVSTSNKEYTWQFHFDAASVRNVQGVFVGISSKCDSQNYLGSSNLLSWAMQCSTGKKVHNGKSTAYGPLINRGDTIGMRLSCVDGQGHLSFTKNGIDIGVAFDGISGTVYPAITLYRRDQQVSLVSFRSRSLHSTTSMK